MSQRVSFWRVLGPGVLFAGAAVGVSHLVQSTRAGAGYGLTLVFFVLLANLVKYPVFRFAPEYAAATGTSILQGYRRQGRWALGLYFLVTLGTMWTVQAAVTVVGAGLLLHLTGLSVSPVLASALLLVVCSALLVAGQYRWLDAITKVAVGLFTVATLIATALAIPRLENISLVPDLSSFTRGDVLFIVALVGWMPTANDVSVWSSLWTLAKRSGLRDEQSPNPDRISDTKQTLVDFHVGYVGTAILAVCFVILGAAVLQDTSLEDRPVAFAAQLIELYGQTLGEWSKPLLGTAAFLVMFSTILTVLDGFPRALSVLIARFIADEVPDEATRKSDRVYWFCLALLAAGSLVVLQFFIASLRSMVDLATTLSFVTAPVFAFLNHRAIGTLKSPPSVALMWASRSSIAIQVAFAVAYLGIAFELW